jgi:hypothetical protein
MAASENDPTLAGGAQYLDCVGALTESGYATGAIEETVDPGASLELWRDGSCTANHVAANGDTAR